VLLKLGYPQTLPFVGLQSNHLGCPHLTKECKLSTHPHLKQQYTPIILRSCLAFMTSECVRWHSQWTAMLSQDIICTNTLQEYYIIGALKMSPYQFQYFIPKLHKCKLQNFRYLLFSCSRTFHQDSIKLNLFCELWHIVCNTKIVYLFAFQYYFCILVCWPRPSAKESLCMIRGNGSDSHYFYWCYGGTHFPPSTGSGDSEWGTVSGTPLLESGMLFLPSPQSRTYAVDAVSEVGS